MADPTPPELDLPNELADWKATDVVDTSTFDEAYFADLAADIEAAVRRLALHQSHEPGLRTTIVLPLRRPSRL